MEDEGTRPGMQHAEHAQLGAQSLGIARQILQRPGGDGKEQIQGDLQMPTQEPPQFFRDSEGHQEVRSGQQQARLLTLQPGVRVGLTALRTVPVIAGMIAVIKTRAVRTLIQVAAQHRGAAGQELVKHLPLPHRHGRAESIQIIRSRLTDQLVNAQAWITVAGDRVHQRSPMN